jgi:hypothetical protein
MSEKHTPGPWTVDANVVIGPPNSGHEIEYDGVEHGVVAVRDTLDPVRWAHDSALIAAAPDCKKALEEIWDTIKQRCGEFQTPTRLQWVGVVDDILTLCEDALNKTEVEVSDE